MFSNLKKYFIISLVLLTNQAFADHHEDHENCHDGDDQKKHEWVKKGGKKHEAMIQKHNEIIKSLIKECLDGATIENNKIKTNC